MGSGADRIAHVVQAIEEGDQVVAGAGEILGACDLEPDAAEHASLARRLARRLDRLGVVVEADEGRVGERLGHEEGRGAVAAADIGHRRAPLELGDHAVERRQPLADQMRVVAGPEEPLGAAEQAGMMLVPADALAGAEGLGDLGLVVEHRGDDLVGAGQEGRPALIGEHGGLFGGHVEALGGGVVGDVAGGGLRGQPFAQIAFGETGALGQLLGVGGALGERFVDAEAVAENDQRRAHRGAHVADHAAEKLLKLCRIDGHCILLPPKKAMQPRAFPSAPATTCLLEMFSVSGPGAQ